MTFGPAELALLGVAFSFIGAAWAITAWAMRAARYEPLMVLTMGAIMLIVGNVYDDNAMSPLELVALLALAIGFSVNMYTIVRRKRLRARARRGD